MHVWRGTAAWGDRRLPCCCLLTKAALIITGTPCEVLAGVAIAEDGLWNLIKRQSVAPNANLFGDYLRAFHIEERKAKRLLKKKRFRSANRNVLIAPEELNPLAHSALARGKDGEGAGAGRGRNDRTGTGRLQPSSASVRP